MSAKYRFWRGVKSILGLALAIGIFYAPYLLANDGKALRAAQMTGYGNDLQRVKKHWPIPFFGPCHGLEQAVYTYTGTNDKDEPGKVTVCASPFSATVRA